MAKVRYELAAAGPGWPRKAEGLARITAPWALRKRERGSILIMTGGTLVLLLVVIAFALELARVYNRKAEMTNVADAVALAAAQQLNGTAGGIENALNAAKETAEGLKYGYGKAVRWSNNAIEFGTSPNGPWSGSGTSTGAESLLFVKVDTSLLGEEYGRVDTTFMAAMSSASANSNVGATAVAGRSTVNVTPFGICAMKPERATARTNPGTAPGPNPVTTPGTPDLVELVEHGFRRGVSYDLMKLNPGASSAAYFVINPIAPPGTLGSSTHTSAAFVEPFICSGTMSMTRVLVTGKPITVMTGPFPLSAALVLAFNSRFNLYAGGPCKVQSAPPDGNMKSYAFGSIPWMTSARSGQAAATQTTTTTTTTTTTPPTTTTTFRLETIADLDPAPSTNTAGMYGPLWSFAKAVPFAAHVPGEAEPALGYSTFAPSDWATLYKPSAPPVSPPAANPPPVANLTTYPTDAETYTPYRMKSGSNMFLAPAGANWPGVRFRRVLNIPLLRCPIASNATVSADVLAIGKFFMTVPATPTSLVAEFAGLTTEQSLSGKVELYP
jgi:hypothetical protein